MIAGCPNCKARYRIEREKLVDGAVRLRCTKCEAVFKVRAPEEPAAAPKAPAPMEVAPPPPQQPEPAPLPEMQAPVTSATPPAAPVASPAAASAPQGPTVLVAMPNEDLAKQTGAALEARGLGAIVVFDGVEAMLSIQREVPAAVVLAAELPKMFGFQVCEVIQRNESLRHIHVVLAGAIHHPDRYRRPPEELYGADSYIEAPDLPEGVFPILEKAGILGAAPASEPPPSAPAPDPGLSVSPPPSAAPAPVPAPQPELEPSPAPAPSVEPPSVAPAPSPPPAPPAASAPVSEAHAEAERLARIIVSDIVLYNEEKFTQAIADGTVAETLGPDLIEGRGLFDARTDAAVRADQDFLLNELLRVARSRGME